MAERKIRMHAKAYEYGDCTVIVKAGTTSAMDGLIRTEFRAQVHPVGGEVVEFPVRAFYPWDAANRAHDIYTKSREYTKRLQEGAAQ